MASLKIVAQVACERNSVGLQHACINRIKQHADHNHITVSYLKNDVLNIQVRDAHGVDSYLLEVLAELKMKVHVSAESWFNGKNIKRLRALNLKGFVRKLAPPLSNCVAIATALTCSGPTLTTVVAPFVYARIRKN